MRFLSLFSGIEAASAAWLPLGWECAAVAEIEPFPCAVLKHHYPDIPNLGDITKITETDIKELGHVDLVVGGFPCQDLSVAGKRKGLMNEDGSVTRSGLFFQAMRIVRWSGARFVLLENVPGIYSSNGGRDFAAVVGEVLGVEFAVPASGWENSGVAASERGLFEWATLDAQYFGVAQRRRRMFALGDFGDWSGRPPVLFERHSLSGHPAPSREAREGVAGTVTRRTCSSVGADDAANGHLIKWPAEVAPTLDAHYGDKMGLENQHINAGGGCSLPTVAMCLNAGAMGRQDAESETLIPTIGGGFDVAPVAIQAGALRTNPRSGPDGVGAQEHIAYTLEARAEVQAVMCEALYNQGITQGADYACAQESHAGSLLRKLREEVGAEAFAEWGLGILDSLQPKEILRQALHGLGIRQATFSRSWVVHCALSRAQERPGWLLQSLREAGCERCASQGWEPPEQLARELGAYLSELSQPGAQAARFVRDLWQAAEGSGVLRQALSAVQKVGRPAHHKTQSAFIANQVRRLTVEECEFLQGFPRGFTLVPVRGKPAADGPRYKALGNSMAVPVMAFIGRRIQQVAAIQGAEVAA